MKAFIKNLFSWIIPVLFFGSCHKSAGNGPSAAGVINVTNAVIGGATITLTTTYSIVGTSNTVGYNSSAWLPLVAGNIPVNLGVPAVAATKTTPAIPAITYFFRTLQVTNSTNYSLFLTGDSPAEIDTVLINETYPYAYEDSVCGVRFINLSPGSSLVSVNVQGNAAGSEVPSLGYKAYSGFIKHPAVKASPSYTFEFRDAVTGDLIASYQLPTPYFHNVTLALRGKVGGNVGVIVDYDFQ